MRCTTCNQEYSQPSEVCPYCGAEQQDRASLNLAQSGGELIQLFHQSISLMLNHLGTLAPIILAVAIPVQLARTYLLTQPDLLPSAGLAMLIRYGVDVPFHALIEPAFFIAVLALPSGRKLTVVDTYREAIHWWPRMFGVYLRLRVLILIGLMLFVVPALWVMVIFAFADLSALLDTDRSKNPFSTSSQLVVGQRLKILVLVILQLILSSAFDSLAHLDRAVFDVWWAGALIASGFDVFVRLFSTVLLLLYVRTRIARGEHLPSFEELFPRLAQRYALIPEAPDA